MRSAPMVVAAAMLTSRVLALFGLTLLGLTLFSPWAMVMALIRESVPPESVGGIVVLGFLTTVAVPLCLIPWTTTALSQVPDNRVRLRPT